MSSSKEGRILSIIRKSPEPISVSQIMAKSRPSLARSTVGRMIASLLKKKLIKSEGSGPKTAYLPSAPQPNSTSVSVYDSDIKRAGSFTNYTSILKNYFKTQHQKRLVVGYDKTRCLNYSGARQLIDDSTLSQLEAVGRPSDGVVSAPAGTFARTIIKTFLAELSFNSSRLEGNTITLAETYEIFDQPCELMFGDLEKTMLINHRTAISWLIDNAHNIDLSSGGDAVKEIHYQLMMDLLAQGKTGTVRNEPVGIGGSSYKPALSRQVLSDSLNLICQKAAQINNPFEQSFFLLLHITYLQAFVDGNKRTGRLMCNYPLIRDNLIPQSFHNIDADLYKDALVYYYETANHEPFLSLFAEGYIGGSDRYIDIQKATETPNIDRLRLRPLRNKLVAEIIRQPLSRSEVQVFIRENAPRIARTLNRSLSDGDIELLISQAGTDLEMLQESKTGLSTFGLSEVERNNWLKAIGRNS